MRSGAGRESRAFCTKKERYDSVYLEKVVACDMPNSAGHKKGAEGLPAQVATTWAVWKPSPSSLMV
jgi:hypothetical protein